MGHASFQQDDKRWWNMMLTADNDDMLQTIRPSMVLKSDRLRRVADLQFEYVGWIVIAGQ